MKKTAIILSIFFICFAQAQTQTDLKKNKNKELKKTHKPDSDARVFIIQKQKKAIGNSKSAMTKEEALKNKKGFKRVNMALNKERKLEKRKEKKSIRTQNRAFNKYTKQSKKRQRKKRKL